MARRNDLVSFLGGLGTGYMQGEKEKRDRDRQERMDQIAIDRANREAQEYNDKKALEDKLSSVPTVEYTDKAQLDGEGLRGAMPGVFSDAETAKNFQDNPNATPTQKAAVLANYAKDERSGANLNGREFVPGDNGTVGTAAATKRPIWQVMQDKSRVYLESGDSQHVGEAAKMLEMSQQLKSKEYQKRISDARRSGLPGLLDLLHEHDNSELGIVKPQVQISADGKTASLTGQSPDGKEIKPRQFDLRKGSVEDQITQQLLTMASPESLGSDILNRIKLARDIQKDDLDERKVDISEKRIATSEQNAIDREDRRDQRQQRNIEAMDKRQSKQIAAVTARNEGNITLPQQANNAEIQLARKRMAGMTTEDVKAKTTQFLPNGRDNPNYDPTIAQAYRTANQRQVGHDPQFDSYSDRVQPLKPQAAKTKPGPADRFKADPTMQGMKLGKLTGKGWEVYSANGQIVGHWK